MTHLDVFRPQPWSEPGQIDSDRLGHDHCGSVWGCPFRWPWMPRYAIFMVGVVRHSRIGHLIEIDFCRISCFTVRQNAGSFIFRTFSGRLG